MSDRNSAHIFSVVFTLLAATPDDRNRAIAAKLFQEAKQYDFSWYQMECNDALAALGLARLGVNPKYPKDGEVWLYGNPAE